MYVLRCIPVKKNTNSSVCKQNKREIFDRGIIVELTSEKARSRRRVGMWLESIRAWGGGVEGTQKGANLKVSFLFTSFNPVS